MGEMIYFIMQVFSFFLCYFYAIKKKTLNPSGGCGRGECEKSVVKLGELTWDFVVVFYSIQTDGSPPFVFRCQVAANLR